MIEDKKLKELILKNKLLEEKKLTEAAKTAAQEQESLFANLHKNGLVPEKKLYALLSEYFKLPLAEIKTAAINKDILFLIPEPIAQAHEIIAYGLSGDTVKIAISDPNDLQTIEFLKKKLGKKLELSLALPTTIKELLKQYHQNLKEELNSVVEVTEDATDSSLKKISQDLPVVRVLDTILEYAIFEEASDIHIEPTEKDIIIRYRVDGILKPVMNLPKTIQAGLIARIKVLTNLKLDEHRLPQDGRFKISSDQRKVAFRVSIFPVYDGEKIVLRLLDESAKALSLEDLGLQKNNLELLENNISKPHGLILVAGPTGSGKTSTLYTIMNKLNTPEVSIATIEDPIEYRVPRVNQSQTNSKIDFTFAKGLKALLRQDPNIIMVGEIRDSETAQIVIHAAMTGHLLLSTIHTNNAATTPQRLINMGLPSYLISSTLNLVIAQNLVRKICRHCIYSYNLDKETIEQLDKNFNLKKVLNFLIKQNLLSKQKDGLESILFYRGKGCKQCGNTGYKGRVGIYELLEITPKISELITAKASADEIQEAALEEGAITLTQDGFIKALSGITSVEEILRVTQE